MNSAISKEQFDKQYPEFAGKTLLEGKCSRKHTIFYFVDNFKESFYVRCPYCNLNCYVVTCKNCQSGYFYTEKEIDMRGAWRCTYCKEDNLIEPNIKLLPSYKKEQLPPEVLRYYNQAFTKIRNLVLVISSLLVLPIFLLNTFGSDNASTIYIVILLIVSITFGALLRGYLKFFRKN